MTDLASEIKWEQDMVDRGVNKFLTAQKEAREQGRADESSAGQTLIRTYLKGIAEDIAEYVNYTGPGKRASDREVLSMMDPNELALITITSIMSELHNPQQTLASTAHAIGNKIERELVLRKFHADYGTYFEEIVRKIEGKNTDNETYKYLSIVGSIRNNKGATVQPWERKQRYTIGLRLVHITLEACDLFEVEHKANRGKGGSFIRPTQACMDWITAHDDTVSLAFPERMPMLIEPADWEGPKNGGYYLPHLRKMTPLVIRSPLATMQGDKWLDIYDTDMPQVFRAGNALQKTPWQINFRVLEVLRDVMGKNLGYGVPQSEPYEFPPCPIGKDDDPRELPENSPQRYAFDAWKSEMREVHEKEAERKAKLYGTLRILGMANRMLEHQAFWFVWRMDFRGRWYCATTGLSPQGSDLGKALLKFKRGKPHGKVGWDNFRVTGANRWGNDKVDNDDRIKWIEENRDKWFAVAGDPLRHSDIWTQADEPYSFLAWCFEYADACSFPGGPENARSFIPCGRDGSCNGLQHFSAMLRDEVGGAAVNLVPASLPSDIYQRVADVVTGKLRSNTTDEAAVNWLLLFNKKGMPGVPRKLTKPPVMTLPYGSTERTCCDSIAQWYNENGDKFFPPATAFKHSLYLSPIVWDSIGEVVIAARAAMAWIRKCTQMLAKEGYALFYVSPLGFPVRQVNEKRDVTRIKTYLSGNLILRTQLSLPNGKLDGVRMMNGSSPNFVHHADATHLMMTVNAMLDDGIQDFAFIHDDFGCHSCDIETMQRHIREQFVKLYTENNLMQSFKDQLEKQSGITLPDLPKTGNLDITQVLQSKYFFA